MDILYLVNWILGGVLILLTFLDLNNPHLSFFSWVPITCIRIEFVPMSLYILCIRSIFTLKVCRSKPQTLGDIGQHFLYFTPRCFQIGQRSFQWALMPCRLKQIDLFYLIDCFFGAILMFISSVALNDPRYSFFSSLPRTCIWI